MLETIIIIIIAGQVFSFVGMSFLELFSSGSSYRAPNPRYPAPTTSPEQPNPIPRHPPPTTSPEQLRRDRKRALWAAVLLFGVLPIALLIAHNL